MGGGLWAGLWQEGGSSSPESSSKRVREGRGGGREHPEADLGGHTDRYTAQERQTHMKEKDKEGANGEEEKEDRHRGNYRWTQKTQVTAIRRQRGQPSEKEDRQVQGSMEIPSYLKYGNT